MQRDFAAGTQAVERAHTQAQAQAQDRIMEDQALVIANLWRVLAWAGIKPEQVSRSPWALTHGLPCWCFAALMAGSTAAA